MSDPEALDERLRAVERALTDSDDDLTDVRNAAERTRELDALGERLDEVETRLDDLDAATQALRGYVGNVRAVNDSVERRADAALAKVQAVEAECDDDRDLPDQNTPVVRRADRRPTDSDQSVPCGCRSRRSEPPTDDAAGSDAAPEGDSQSASDDGDTGLLARIAEVL